MLRSIRNLKRTAMIISSFVIVEKQEVLVEYFFALAKACGEAFLKGYQPIVQKRKDITSTDDERQWQLFRRGRYAEFNLVQDRGTLFGLKTNGRVESILMSLPPLARWEYDYHPVAGSREDVLQQILMKPVSWV